MTLCEILDSVEMNPTEWSIGDEMALNLPDGEGWRVSVPESSFKMLRAVLLANEIGDVIRYSGGYATIRSY